MINVAGSTSQGKLIASPGNSWVKAVRALQHRKDREEQGKYFVEGIRPVWQALAGGSRVEALVLAEDLLTSQDALKMVETHAALGVQVVRVSGGVFESIARREHPSGLGALVHMAHLTLEDFRVNAESIFVALLEPGNPGNIGTIMRTLDAVGGSGLILIGDSTDPYHPSSVKASMGALFSVPVVRIEKLNDLLNWCESEQLKVITTSPDASAAYWAIDYPFPLMFLFGSEAEGLNGETVARGNMAVRIPMAGTADSLNLAVSVGILLYEVKRQRASESERIKVIG